MKENNYFAIKIQTLVNIERYCLVVQKSNMIRVFVYIDNEQKYRCLLADIQRYYFLARTYKYRPVWLIPTFFT